MYTHHPTSYDARPGLKRKRHESDVTTEAVPQNEFDHDAAWAKQRRPSCSPFNVNCETDSSTPLNCVSNRHSTSELGSGFKPNPKPLICQQLLSSMSDQLRQYLFHLYRIHYNDHIQLLPPDQLRGIYHQNGDQQDVVSTMFQIAVMAMGLLHADPAREEIGRLRPAGSDRSILHHILKDSVETGVLCGQDFEQLPITLLLSELERAIGRVGAAELYLREAVRIAEHPQLNQFDLSISDEEILHRRSHVRATEFIRRQWSLFQHFNHSHKTKPRVSFTALHRPEYLRIQNMSQSDPVRSIYLAHLDLLRIGEAAVQSLGITLHRDYDNFVTELAKACQSLNDWYHTLPEWMSWENRKDHSPPSLFLLHQQYFAILILLGGLQTQESTVEEHHTADNSTDCGKLADLITEYAKHFPTQDAPLIVAYHAQAAVKYLTAKIAVSTAGHDTTRDMSLLQNMQKVLKIMSQTYAVDLPSNGTYDTLIYDALGAPRSLPHLNGEERAGFDHDPLAPQWEDLGLFDIGLENNGQSVTFMPLSSTDVSLTYDRRIPEALGGSAARITSYDGDDRASSSPAAESEKASPSLRNRDSGEERLVLISDPVFCAYVDEVSYIVGQYSSPKDQGDQHGADSGSRRGSQNSPSRDAIEQLRAHLGHDVPSISVYAQSSARHDDQGNAIGHGLNLTGFMPPIIAHS